MQVEQSYVERIASSLERIAKAQERIAVCAEAVNARKAAPAAGGGGELASDYEMSGEHGDPMGPKKAPKDWTGPSQLGKRFSECLPEYLDQVASLLDWKASKEAAEPAKAKYAKYSLLDAKRARGWAARIRSGWKPAEKPASSYSEPEWTKPAVPAELVDSTPFDDTSDLDGGDPAGADQGGW